jgi:ADP-ribose pyrophosphatase YjhB (NUDIX family)
MKLMCFVLIERARKFLMIQEASKKNLGRWYFPGGNADEHEDLQKAAIREAKEEAGCKIKLTGIFLVKYNNKVFHNRLLIYYTGKVLSSRLKKKADKHSLKAAWFSFREIAKLPLRDNALEIFNLYRKGKKAIIPTDHMIISTKY